LIFRKTVIRLHDLEYYEMLFIADDKFLTS